MAAARGRPAINTLPPTPVRLDRPLSGPHVSVPGNGKRFKLLELL